MPSQIGAWPSSPARACEIARVNTRPAVAPTVRPPRKICRKRLEGMDRNPSTVIRGPAGNPRGHDLFDPPIIRRIRGEANPRTAKRTALPELAQSTITNQQRTVLRNRTGRRAKLSASAEVEHLVGRVIHNGGIYTVIPA